MTKMVLSREHCAKGKRAIFPAIVDRLLRFTFLVPRSLGTASLRLLARKLPHFRSLYVS